MSMPDKLSLENNDSEVWEAAIENIPEELYETYAPIVAGFYWTVENCANILKVINHCGGSKIDVVMEKIFGLSKSRIIPFILTITQIYDPQLEEFVVTSPPEMFNRFVELIYYGDSQEVKILVELMSKMSVAEIYKILQKCDEPLAKHCRLCRVKRISKLEFKMLNGQFPDDSIHSQLPGMVEIYEKKTEMWSADNESSFRFDERKSIIYWKSHVVDLIQICDECLNEAYRAASEVGRYESTYHLEGEERKALNTKRRMAELTRTNILYVLAQHIAKRRCKEWSIRILHKEQIAQANELKAKQNEVNEANRKNNLETYINTKKKLMSDAKEVDKKWLQIEAKHQATKNAVKFDLAELKWAPKYTTENPFHTKREHPHSWKLSQYDGKNMPVGQQSACKRFGLGELTPDIRTTELQQFKSQAEVLYQGYLENERAKKEREDADRAKEVASLQAYVAEKLYLAEKRRKDKLRDEEQAEEDRLLARRLDRHMRRAEKIAQMEREENMLMREEDARSHAERYFQKEQAIIRRELAGMRLEESKQTAIDVFWGIPTYIVSMKNKMSDDKKRWKHQVDELRKMCIEVKVTRPFEWEYGLFRDRVTNLPIV